MRKCGKLFVCFFSEGNASNGFKYRERLIRKWGLFVLKVIVLSWFQAVEFFARVSHWLKDRDIRFHGGSIA